MLLPEKRRPRGNGRRSRAAVRRCMRPTSGGGLAARRTIACDESSSVVTSDPRLRDLFAFSRPSIWFLSMRDSPSSESSKSSLMEVIGITQMGLAPLKNERTGTERRHKMREYDRSLTFSLDLLYFFVSKRFALAVSSTSKSTSEAVRLKLSRLSALEMGARVERTDTETDESSLSLLLASVERIEPTKWALLPTLPRASRRYPAGAVRQ